MVALLFIPTSRMRAYVGEYITAVADINKDCNLATEEASTDFWEKESCALLPQDTVPIIVCDNKYLGTFASNPERVFWISKFPVWGYLQTEQMSAENKRNGVTRLCSGHIPNAPAFVIDYSQSNMSIITRERVPSHLFHIPPCDTVDHSIIQERWERTDSDSKSSDEESSSDESSSGSRMKLAWCGAVTPRRKAVFDALDKLGIEVRVVKAWGRMRDEEIASCDALINVHAFPEYTVFESVRCFRWIISGFPVITEHASGIATELLSGDSTALVQPPSDMDAEEFADWVAREGLTHVKELRQERSPTLNRDVLRLTRRQCAGQLAKIAILASELYQGTALDTPPNADEAKAMNDALANPTSRRETEIEYARRWFYSDGRGRLIDWSKWREAKTSRRKDHAVWVHRSHVIKIEMFTPIEKSFRGSLQREVIALRALEDAGVHAVVPRVLFVGCGGRFVVQTNVGTGVSRARYLPPTWERQIRDIERTFSNVGVRYTDWVLDNIVVRHDKGIAMVDHEFTARITDKDDTTLDFSWGGQTRDIKKKPYGVVDFETFVDGLRKGYPADATPNGSKVHDVEKESMRSEDASPKTSRDDSEKTKSGSEKDVSDDDASDSGKRFLCIRQFYDADEAARESLIVFLTRGGVLDHPHKTVLVVNSDDGTIFDEAAKVLQTMESSVRVIFRPNKGLDYGSFSCAIQHVEDAAAFDGVFFVNSTVFGPCCTSSQWTSWFCRVAASQSADAVGVFVNPSVGTGWEPGDDWGVGPGPNHRALARMRKDTSESWLNYLYPHVQTFAFYLSKLGLETLRRDGLFNHSEDEVGTWSRTHVIRRFERGLSRILLQNNMNIASLTSDITWNSAVRHLEYWKSVSGRIWWDIHRHTNDRSQDNASFFPGVPFWKHKQTYKVPAYDFQKHIFILSYSRSEEEFDDTVNKTVSQWSRVEEDAVIYILATGKTSSCSLPERVRLLHVPNRREATFLLALCDILVQLEGGESTVRDCKTLPLPVLTDGKQNVFLFVHDTVYPHGSIGRRFWLSGKAHAVWTWQKGSRFWSEYSDRLKARLKRVIKEDPRDKEPLTYINTAVNRCLDGAPPP
jgi:hypothetical protein